MKHNNQVGKVILAGAGPGDPELLTLKACRYLGQADVVITDRLVSQTILNDYVRKDALILQVGKQGRGAQSTPQALINELLIEYAQQNKLVVRLKGGDVAIFSNLLDELQALTAKGIPYEIIPGITAASGAAAYTGIPLTARGHAIAVRLLTYYKKDLLNTQHWADLAATDDTLVFYMSSGTLEELVAALLAHGISQDKYIAVIEQATTPEQRTISCRLHQYHALFGNNAYASPTLIIIGRVAGLHEQFQWIPELRSPINYFNPVAKPLESEARA